MEILFSLILVGGPVLGKGLCSALPVSLRPGPTFELLVTSSIHARVEEAGWSCRGRGEVGSSLPRSTLCQQVIEFSGETEAESPAAGRIPKAKEKLARVRGSWAAGRLHFCSGYYKADTEVFVGRSSCLEALGKKPILVGRI